MYNECLQCLLLVIHIENISRPVYQSCDFHLFEKKRNMHESIWRQYLPLVNISSFFFSTAKYFCSLFATDAYDKKLNYCSSFQYAFLRGSLWKNKHLKEDAEGLVLYTALLYYSLQCIFNVSERKVKYMLISTVR